MTRTADRNGTALREDSAALTLGVASSSCRCLARSRPAALGAARRHPPAEEAEHTLRKHRPPAVLVLVLLVVAHAGR